MQRPVRIFLSAFALVATLVGIVPLNFAQDEAKQEFASPSAPYRLGINVHGVPATPEAREAKIASILEAGYGRISTNVNWTDDYLQNDEELEKFCDFARLAKSQGLEVWLYDENAYPSGMAGDVLLNENPDWEVEGIFFRKTEVAPKAEVALAPDGKTRLLAFAAPVGADGEADLTRRVDLIDRRDENGKLLWKNESESETWIVAEIGSAFLRENFQSGTVRGAKAWRYTSLLLPEVGKRFIEATHQKYAAALGEPLGNVFAATFTDEPSAMAMQYGPSAFGVYPWKSNVSDEYEKRSGRPLLDDLPTIMLDAGFAGREYRHLYFSIVADLMSASFFQQIQDFNATQGLKSSGHLLLEESLLTHAPLYGDVMKCYRKMDVPGIDALTGTPAETRSYLYSSRLASSAAELSGGSDVMCENCPISDAGLYGGQEAPTDRLRGVVNREIIGGVTKFSDYMQLSREDAAGKRRFNEYVGRIVSQLSGGKRAAKIGVFYPIESVWARYRPFPTRLKSWNGASGCDPAAERIDRAFTAVSDALYDANWEFSYLDDRAIRDATVDGGALQIGTLRWEAVVLPATELISEEAFAKLRQFNDAGGKLIFIENFPIYSEREFPSENYVGFALDLLNRSTRSLDSGVYFQQQFDAAALNAILEGIFEREISFGDAKNVFSAHRVKGAISTFFVVNDSEGAQTPTATLSAVDGESVVEIWNPTTGEISEVETKNGEPTTLTVELDGFTGTLIKRYRR